MGGQRKTKQKNMLTQVNCQVFIDSNYSNQREGYSSNEGQDKHWSGDPLGQPQHDSLQAQQQPAQHDAPSEEVLLRAVNAALADGRQPDGLVVQDNGQEVAQKYCEQHL